MDSGISAAARALSRADPLTALKHVALLALCFAGVRFAFAGAIVGTTGLVWLIRRPSIQQNGIIRHKDRDARRGNFRPSLRLHRR